jgi:hypothetical protein
MVLGTCEINVADPAQVHARKLTLVIYENYRAIALGVIVVVLALVGLIFLAWYTVESLRHYYRHVKYGNTLKDGENDQETYEDRDSMMNKLFEPRTERSAIMSKLANIEAKYKPYNREMGSYTRNVLDREPDNLMKREEIIPADNDDFDYSK